jgi:hypothetical protein
VRHGKSRQIFGWEAKKFRPGTQHNKHNSIMYDFLNEQLLLRSLENDNNNNYNYIEKIICEKN